MKPKVFVTSDTFFGRVNIIEIAKRPFSSIEEMDAALVDRWNKVVGENDIVYHLGNFAWTPSAAHDALNSLNGEIRFILGEYDSALMEVFEYFDDIEIVPHEIFKNYNDKIVMSHWPLENWPGKTEGIFHFHGNTLSNLKTDLTKLNRFNVSSDANNFTPQNIETLFEIFNDFINIPENSPK